jgi:hypothetical protein
MKTINLLFLLSLYFVGTFSQVKADSTNYKVNTLNKKKWESISSGLDYTEEDKKKEPQKTEKKEEPTNKNIDFSFLAPFLKVIGFILILGILGFIIARLIPAIVNKNAAVKQSIKIDIGDTELKEENIAEWPLEKLLSNYIKDGDLRNAIRIYYLTTLQLMHMNGVIIWKADKTNSHYVSEFSEHANAKDFSDLTRIYETIWYGQLIPDETMFSIASNMFNTFNTQFHIPNEK